MKSGVTTALAVVIVIALSAATFKAATAIGGEQFYASFGFSWLAAIKPIREFLAKRRLSLTLAPDPDDVVPSSAFWLPWSQMLVYSMFGLAGALQLVGFIVGLTASFLGVQRENLGPVLVVAAVLMAPVIIFMIGSWIGSYCSKGGVAVLFAAVLGARIITGAVDYLILSPQDFLTVFGQPKSIGTASMMTVVGVVIYSVFAAVFGLLGYRRGMQLRPARYLRYLLRRVPTERHGELLSTMYSDVLQGAHHGGGPLDPVPAAEG